MKILTAIGARPQFVKTAILSEELKKRGVEEILVHSGQHYDDLMSDVFFRELGIPEVAVNYEVGSGSHGVQTGKMLAKFEQSLLEFKPAAMLVHGDTNSTLAAALAAAKLEIPVVHNEAGLRSYNRSMPEEHNRVLTDHCSDTLFCPTQVAVDNLAKEGITAGVHRVGDVMFDVARRFRPVAEAKSDAMQRFELTRGKFVLVTLHRPYNVDDPDRMRLLFDTMSRVDRTFVFPVHPRTRGNLAAFGIDFPANVRSIDPLGYLDFLQLEANAGLIMTDSGGVQKEAYFAGVPCVTVRPETEWVETVNAGWNRLLWDNLEQLDEMLTTRWWPEEQPELYGDGNASAKIAELLAGKY
ncbi:UDP-N-acetylglucosamine 2-epimerase (non-hydrolyzing) [bacterium]|nr:UDP-N-acetylglucosamine 2-epimerase (non-hydrolyzing) [bacterium]